MPRPPRFLQSQPNWRHIGISAGRFIGVKAAQGVAGLALGFAAIATADTVPSATWRPVAEATVLGGAAGICAVAVWIKTRGGGRRRNPSTDSQAHNQSIQAPSRRFRRG